MTRHAVGPDLLPDPPLQRHRDVLRGVARRFWDVRDLDGVSDPGTAVDIVVEHLAPVVAARLAQQGWRPPTERHGRPLTPNWERVLGAAGGALAAVLLIAVIVLVVWQVTS